MPDLIKVENLVKYFPVAAGNVHAVDDVSFAIREGETLGLVGESGCGKSTTGRLLIRLIEATSGRTLDPRKSIGETIGKPLEIFGMGSKREREEMVDALMEKVGLSPRLFYKYPHELDGGRRQRVGIARALSLSPSFIVCDEPVSALDVSIQAQILNLLKELQETMKLTYLFVSHDLSVVKHISNRIAVMYLGKIVESSPSLELFSNTLHPYSQALLAAVPIPKLNRKRERFILSGGVPSPINPPSGCRFHTRCPWKMDICSREEPPLTDRGGGHFVACHKVK
jgi:peptide/nickel transport system ATP-binding protein/oligopeptide transport system ATP-binding protein